MNELLLAAANAISSWLELKLPQLDGNWWGNNVLSRLTFQQQRIVEEKRITALSQLDIAAILRILDCPRALNFDHPCALNFDQGRIAAGH